MAGDARSPRPLEKRIAALSRDLAEAVEQQQAAAQVLAVIGRSTSDLEPVFETVVDSAIRLCKADGGYVFQLEGDVYRLAYGRGGSAEYDELLAGTSLEPGPGTLIGRVAAERRTVQIADVLADPQYEWQAGARVAGYRTMLGVPIVTGEQVAGVISLWRRAVEPFSERAIEVVTTFASQGAIAVENVRLFREAKRRSAELARSVDRLRALGDVSRAVSSTLDLEEVLSLIVTHAVRVSGTEGGSIFEFDAGREEFHIRTAYGTSAELVERLRRTRIRLNETLVGRSAALGHPLQIADVDAVPPDPHLLRLREAGWRSVLAVPLLRENEIVGALVVRRTVRGDFSRDTVGLLQTLANQSTVAIHNARVFRELGEKTSALEVASRHKSQFLASMSHELRTPLNAVIGFSDVLLERMFGDLNERQDEYLRDIRESGRHLLALLNEILDLSKIEAGRMELEPARVPLADVLEHGLTMVRERATAHGIELRLEVEPEVGTVRADELRLKQVVLNLLTNAVKFTPDGGSVEVRACLAADEAHVTVTDTGIGIAEDDRERIFEAFNQGDRAARSSAEGTGLGLTLSKRIVELHGGRMWVTSEPGVGSTFGFSVPVGVPAPAPDAPAHLEESPGAGARRTVVVVEDDRHSLDLLTVYLESAGFAVVAARDGEAGLELVRTLRPVAVVLDILLPGLDGWDVLARLKHEPATRDVPVVVTSMLDERGHGFALGAAAYLVKPVARDDVLDALARCATEPHANPVVLVVDDDPVALALVAAVLEPRGYDVLRAGNGEDGLRLAREAHPALVLVDLLMPGMDGFALIERLRGDPETEQLPVVVLTAKSMTSDDQERLRGRISALAQKGGVDPAGLLELVRRLVGGDDRVEAAWPAS